MRGRERLWSDILGGWRLGFFLEVFCWWRDLAAGQRAIGEEPDAPTGWVEKTSDERLAYGVIEDKRFESRCRWEVGRKWGCEDCN
jgi:hypothetical protein